MPSKDPLTMVIPFEVDPENEAALVEFMNRSGRFPRPRKWPHR
ncbi:predicted protein [Streptomyces iranensis]|uniref:Uncharacterized protein n=1 Tax=Streptomyces iranensis TaxID=576784 RepID=A0A061A4B8_9ACTN|nr:hypothetical protein [Streptomyces iranensis]CDR16994.1 predicted protein [Streptomyces iranensis]